MNYKITQIVLETTVHPASPNVNILHNHITIITDKKLALVQYYTTDFILTSVSIQTMFQNLLDSKIKPLRT